MLVDQTVGDDWRNRGADEAYETVPPLTEAERAAETIAIHGALQEGCVRFRIIVAPQAERCAYAALVHHLQIAL